MSESKTAKSEVREGERIAKVMARAGLCSRRDAEAWIAAGRVSVNGEVLASPAYNVGNEDDVRVDGERLPAPERTRLFFFHKPRGLVTTARDPEGRATIFEALPADLPRVVAVGRLDINTEGLLLLTNDGGLARVLELPATGWLRRYRVRAHGEITQAQLDGLRDGVTIEGIHYAGIEARLEREQGSNVWIMMGLREGKNREIKRVLEHLGVTVNRLIRVSFGPFELGDLPEGAVAELNTRILRDQLGLKLAKQAGANFDAPIETPRPAAAAPEQRLEGHRPAVGRGDRPPMRAREDRAAIAAELAARGKRKETAEPRKRKHVSILRAEARAEAAGPRKRIARGATADRKGREIKVERIVTVREPEAASEARFARSGAKRGFAEGGDRRSREFREAPAEAKPKRPWPKREFPKREDAAAAREGRPFHAAPKRDEASGGDRPKRPWPKREFPKRREAGSAGEDRPFRTAPNGREAPREDRPARSWPKREFPNRRDAAPAGEARPFRAGPKREFAGKAFDTGPRRDGGKTFGKRPGKRPPRKS